MIFERNFAYHRKKGSVTGEYRVTRLFHCSCTRLMWVLVYSIVCVRFSVDFLRSRKKIALLIFVRLSNKRKYSIYIRIFHTAHRFFAKSFPFYHYFFSDRIFQRQEHTHVTIELWNKCIKYGVDVFGSYCRLQSIILNRQNGGNSATAHQEIWI